MVNPGYFWVLYSNVDPVRFCLLFWFMNEVHGIVITVACFAVLQYVLLSTYSLMSQNSWGERIVPLLGLDYYYLYFTYLLHKLVVRYFVGTKIHQRGWGRETFWSALFHQIATGILWCVCFADASSKMGIIDWLDAGRFSGPSFYWERLVMAMQMAEMISDVILYRSYPGFGIPFWLHHIITFLATGVSFNTLQATPVGIPVTLVCWMELGSIPLNLANLFPSPTAFRARAIGYTATRMFSTLIAARATYLAIYFPNKFVVSLSTHFELTFV